MAIVTKTIGTAVEAEGTATLQIDYDDADLRVRVVRIINTHPTLTARVTARRNDGTGPPLVGQQLELVDALVLVLVQREEDALGGGEFVAGELAVAVGVEPGEELGCGRVLGRGARPAAPRLDQSRQDVAVVFR